MLVKEFLGHASLDNTLLYIQVEQAIFGLNSDDEYTVQATNDKEEMKKLLSVGFEYVLPERQPRLPEKAQVRRRKRDGVSKKPAGVS